MGKEIVNRVSKSPLININLEDYCPKNPRVIIDITKWLHQGIVLREKEFRAHLKSHDWSQYQDMFVAIRPLQDVIIPIWSYLLVTIYLQGISKKTILGDLQLLEYSILEDSILKIDVSKFQGKPVIIKGCNNNIPEEAYITLVQRLIPSARSIMYGEACSSVPLFKKTTTS